MKEDSTRSNRSCRPKLEHFVFSDQTNFGFNQNESAESWTVPWNCACIYLVELTKIAFIMRNLNGLRVSYLICKEHCEQN